MGILSATSHRDTIPRLAASWLPTRVTARASNKIFDDDDEQQKFEKKVEKNKIVKMSFPASLATLHHVTPLCRITPQMSKYEKAKNVVEQIARRSVTLSSDTLNNVDVTRVLEIVSQRNVNRTIHAAFAAWNSSN